MKMKINRDLLPIKAHYFLFNGGGLTCSMFEDTPRVFHKI